MLRNADLRFSVPALLTGHWAVPVTIIKKFHRKSPLIYFVCAHFQNKTDPIMDRRTNKKKLSKHLLEMKFMKRTREKTELQV